MYIPCFKSLSVYMKVSLETSSTPNKSGTLQIVSYTRYLYFQLLLVFRAALQYFNCNLQL